MMATYVVIDVVDPDLSKADCDMVVHILAF